MITRFSALWHVVEDLLAEDGPPASGRAVVDDFEIEGSTVRAVRLFGVEPVAAEWQRTPTLHIDATVDMELLCHRVPHAELIGEVDAATPHMRIVQYPDKAFGKYALRNHRFLFKIWDWAVAYASMMGGDWGIIVPKEAEITILSKREIPSFISLHHFGALRGLDELKDVRGVIGVGRPMASPDKVERMAGALSGRAAQTVADDWYPAEIVQLRAKDGSVASVEADRHPDPLAESIRAFITEGELIQGPVGRPRGLNRDAENPVEVVLLTNVPVPGVVLDELRQWHGPTVDEEILGQFGAALESAGDAAKVAGLTLRQVKDRRQRMDAFSYNKVLYGNASILLSAEPLSGGGSPLCQAVYQLAGPGRSQRRVVYDPRRVADCRAWLTDRLGTLAYFDEVDVEQSADVPVPEPVEPEQAVGAAGASLGAGRAGVVGTGVVIPFPTKEPPATHALANDAPAEPEPAQAWAAGCAALSTISAPSGFTPPHWQRVIDAAGQFIERWADEATACGWSSFDVFGCHDEAPTVRRDAMGMVVMLGDCTVVSIDERGADIATPSGARQRFSRRSMPVGTVLLWELSEQSQQFGRRMA
jgi:hypothetical protein